MSDPEHTRMSAFPKNAEHRAAWLELVEYSARYGIMHSASRPDHPYACRPYERWELEALGASIATRVATEIPGLVTEPWTGDQLHDAIVGRMRRIGHLLDLWDRMEAIEQRTLPTVPPHPDGGS